MERIVFFDIDGTLLDEEKRIPPSAIETIERLKENGVRVALATGRAPFMFRDILAQLGIDDFVSFNGQYVEVGGNVLYKRTIDAERLAAIEEAAKARRHPMAFLDENFMTANVDGHPWVETSMNDLKLDPPPYDPHGHEGRGICQALLFCEEHEEHLYTETFTDLDFIRWHRYSLDVMPPGGSKAVGIRIVCEHFGIAPDQVYAFGDARNDVEMLREAAVGVAMGGAEPEAIAAADWVTDRPEEDGIYNACKKLGLI